MLYLFLVILYWTSYSIILFRTLELPVYIHLSQILCQMCLHNIHKQLYCSRKEQCFLDLFSYVSKIHVYKDTVYLYYFPKMVLGYLCCFICYLYSLSVFRMLFVVMLCYVALFIIYFHFKVSRTH